MRNPRPKGASLGKDALLLTVAKVATLVITMVSGMLLSRFRTLEEYGTYSQINMVITLAISLFTLGLPNSINYFIARTDNVEERRHFLSSYYTLNTLLCAIMGITLFALTPVFELYFKNAYIRCFAYVFLALPWSQVIISSIQNFLVVYHKSHLLVYFTISHSLATLLVVLLAVWLQWSFSLYMVVFIIESVLFALLVYGIVWRVAGRIRVQLDWRLIRQIFVYSVPLGLATVVGTLKTETDKLLIGFFYTTEQLAIYSNASKELPLSIFATSLTAVLLPKMVTELNAGRKKEALHLWGTATIISYVIICFFTVGLFTYAPEVMSLFYSEKYLSGVPVFRIYTLLSLLRCTYFGMILNSSGKTKLIFYSSIAALVLNVALNFVFYRLFGFIGPALATIVATIFSTFFLLAATSHSIKVPFREIFPWKQLGIITGINIVLGIVFYFLKKALPLQAYIGEIGESLLLGCLWGVLYAGLMFRYVYKKYRILNQ